MKNSHIKAKKFGREKDQRQALILGLTDSLLFNESIETTLPKAKVLKSHTEKLITKAKKNDLHHRRLVMKGTATKDAANKLVDEIAPKLTSRNSGYLRIERTKLRRGDGAQLAKVTFIDDLSQTPAEDKPAKAETKPAAAAKAAKPASTKADKDKK